MLRTNLRHKQTSTTIVKTAISGDDDAGHSHSQRHPGFLPDDIGPCFANFVADLLSLKDHTTIWNHRRLVPLQDGRVYITGGKGRINRFHFTDLTGLEPVIRVVYEIDGGWVYSDSLVQDWQSQSQYFVNFIIHVTCTLYMYMYTRAYDVYTCSLLYFHVLTRCNIYDASHNKSY